VLPSYEKAVRDLSEPPPPYTANVTVALPLQNRINRDMEILPVNDNRGLLHTLRSIYQHCAKHNSAIVMAIMFASLSIVSMAALVVGARDRVQCSETSRAAAWLIVFGVVGSVCCWTTFILVSFLHSQRKTVFQKKNMGG
jgi:hypothetical protein